MQNNSPIDIDAINLPDHKRRERESQRAWSKRSMRIAGVMSVGITIFCFMHFGLPHTWGQLLAAAFIALWSAGMFVAEVLVEYQKDADAQRSRSWVAWNYSKSRRYAIRSGVFALKQSYFNVSAHQRENDHVAETLRTMGVGSKAHGYRDGYTEDQIAGAMENLRDTRFAVIVASMMHEAGTTITILLGIPSLLLAVIFGAFSLFQVGTTPIPETPWHLVEQNSQGPFGQAAPLNAIDSTWTPFLPKDPQDSSYVPIANKNNEVGTSKGSLSSNAVFCKDYEPEVVPKPRTWEMVVRVTLLSIAFFLLTGWAFVHLHSLYLRKYVLTIPAERYAAITANTLEHSQMIVMISYLIHEMCHAYLNVFRDSEGDRLAAMRPQDLTEDAFLLGRQQDILWRAFLKHPDVVTDPVLWSMIYNGTRTSNPSFARCVKSVMDIHFEYDNGRNKWFQRGGTKASDAFRADINKLIAPRIGREKLTPELLLEGLYGADAIGARTAVRSQLIAAFRADTVIHEYVQAESRDVDSARIEALIRALCNRSGMRYEDACEHLFQFSPHLYRVRAEKVRQNLLVLLDMLDMDLGDSMPSLVQQRMLKLIRQNAGRKQRLAKICRRQAQNIIYYDMHPRIMEIAGTRSCSEAVKHYLNGLADVAYWRRRTTMKNDASKNWQFQDRLYYLLRKSEAHVGLNLHHAACELIEGLNNVVADNKPDEESSAGSRTYQNASKLLDLSGWPKDSEVIARLGMENYARWLKADVSESLSKEEIEKNDAIEEHLYKLDVTGIAYMDLMRQDVVESFKKGPSYKRLLDWYNEGSEVFIVTFGYSKAVRDAMHDALAPSDIDAAAKKLSGEHKGSLHNIKFAVVVMEEVDTEEALRVKYMCSFGDHRKSSSSELRGMVVAESEFVTSLLHNNSRLLLLTGADAFDRKHKKFVKTGNRRSHYSTLLAKAKVLCSQEAELVVLAESYKHVADLPQQLHILGQFYHSVEVYDVTDTERFCTNRDQLFSA